jgi:hypothetical protein
MFDAKFWGPNQMRRRENSEFMAQSLPRPAFPHFHPSHPTATGTSKPVSSNASTGYGSTIKYPYFGYFGWINLRYKL